MNPYQPRTDDMAFILANVLQAPALLQALSAIKLRAEAEQNDLRGQLQAALAENTRLNNQLTELQNSRAAYENSLENLYESSSWRLTAPLRALHRLFRH